MSTLTTTDATARHIRAQGLDVWVEERGSGPAVLLLGGLSDPVESWSFQLDALADRYHVIAFDNPGAGRTALPDGELTIELMVDIAADVLRAVGVESAHVAGFSGGSANGQHLALRHPELVRSLVLLSTWARPDPYMQAALRSWAWLPTGAPSEEAMLEAFFLWIYTARAHEQGMVAEVIRETMAYPHPQSPEAFVTQIEAWSVHDTYDRLPTISVPTLVIAGGDDLVTPPRLGRVVADRIPGARFVLMDGEAHQPMQEVPEEWNALVDAFWQEVDAA